MRRLISSTCILLTCGCLLHGQEVKPDPNGIWKWNRANPDGKIPEITLTLEAHGQALSGTLIKSSGQTTITNGVIRGDQISFQTVRVSKNGIATTSYTGKVSGDTIAGKVAIDTSGKKFSADWEVKRVKK